MAFGAFKKPLTHWPKQEDTEQSRTQGGQWGWRDCEKLQHRIREGRNFEDHHREQEVNFQKGHCSGSCSPGAAVV